MSNRLTKLIAFLSLMLSICLFISCSDRTRSLPRKRSGKLPVSNYIKKVFSQAELDKILYIGMTSEDVIKKIGKPYIALDSILIYKINPSKISVERNTFYTSGFSVNINDDKVICWGIISTIIKTDPNDNNSKKQNNW